MMGASAGDQAKLKDFSNGRSTQAEELALLFLKVMDDIALAAKKVKKKNK